MKKVFGIGILAITAAMTMGCAANQQCLRKVDELQAKSYQQDKEIRDLNAEVAIVSSQHAEGDLASLARDGWNTAVAAFHWTTAEAPIAYRQAADAYDKASARMERARKCYSDHAGTQPRTFEDYRAIAMMCLNEGN